MRSSQNVITWGAEEGATLRQPPLSSPPRRAEIQIARRPRTGAPHAARVGVHTMVHVRSGHV